MRNKYKLTNPNNKYYKYAIQQEIERGISGLTAPHKYPPDIDLHPLINAYRNRKFGIESNEEKGWYEFLKKKIGSVETALTLGSGEGRHERSLTELGVVNHWTSIDLTENPLDDFTDKFENNFIYGDLNFITLPKNKFDLVYCHGVLHHIINLEYLFEQIYYSLKPNGILVVYEYVGPAKWQWEKQRLRILRKEILENKDLNNIYFKSKSIYFMNQRPLESIRSDEIYNLIHNFFNVDYENYWNKIIYPFLNSRIVPKNSFDEDYISKMISFAISLEDKYKEDKQIENTELNGIYRRKSNFKLDNVIPWNEKQIKYLLGKHYPSASIIINKLINKLKRTN